MPQDQFITLRQWFVDVWQKRMGKTIDQLAVKTGFNKQRLEDYLDERRVSTLGEWWNLLGHYVYKNYQAFANDLNALVPAQRPIRASSISDWYSGRRTPAFEEWRQALFVFTALPIYASGDRKLVSLPQTVDFNFDVLQGLTLTHRFSVEFLKELSELWSKNLLPKERQKVRVLVAEHLSGLRAIGEDRQVVEEIEQMFR